MKILACNRLTGLGHKTLTIVGMFFLAGCLFFSNSIAAAEKKPIKIDITTHLGDVKDFQEGDRISFLLSLDTDAYITVLYQDAKGGITQILPNKKQAGHFFRAGVFLALPDKASAFAFKIQPPFGRESLWAFASDVPLSELKGRYLADGLKTLHGGMGSIRKNLRAASQSAYGEAHLDLYTHARQ